MAKCHNKLILMFRGLFYSLFFNFALVIYFFFTNLDWLKVVDEISWFLFNSNYVFQMCLHKDKNICLFPLMWRRVKCWYSVVCLWWKFWNSECMKCNSSVETKFKKVNRCRKKLLKIDTIIVIEIISCDWAALWKVNRCFDVFILYLIYIYVCAFFCLWLDRVLLSCYWKYLHLLPTDEHPNILI